MKKKSRITKEQVRHISFLANLELGEEEVTFFQAQLEKILAYMERIKRLDLENIEPTSQITGLENVFREDKVVFGLTQEEALSSAKKKKQGFFVVKAIFDEI